MNTSQTGVLPLVCVVCEQPVGIINATALAEMLGSGEAYVCDSCGKLIDDEDRGGIAAYLESCPPDHYAGLVSAAIMEAGL